MRKLIVFLPIVFLILPLKVFGQEKQGKPLTMVDVHAMGPQKLGNLLR